MRYGQFPGAVRSVTFRFWLCVTTGLLLVLATSCGDDEPSKPVVVSVEPATATVEVGQTRQFTATVTGTANQGVSWLVDGGAADGTISAAGLYLAPGNVPDPDTVVVRATSVAVGTKSGTAAVTVVGPAPAEFVWVPAGSFRMGDGTTYCGTQQHDVTLKEGLLAIDLSARSLARLVECSLTGADVIFIESPESVEEMKLICSSCKAETVSKKLMIRSGRSAKSAVKFSVPALLAWKGTPSTNSSAFRGEGRSWSVSWPPISSINPLTERSPDIVPGAL